jgi:hypothetical protein
VFGSHIGVQPALASHSGSTGPTENDALSKAAPPTPEMRADQTEPATPMTSALVSFSPSSTGFDSRRASLGTPNSGALSRAESGHRYPQSGQAHPRGSTPHDPSAGSAAQQPSAEGAHQQDHSAEAVAVDLVNILKSSEMKIAHNVVSTAVLVGGPLDLLQTLLKLTDNRVPIVVIEGSGDLADIIAFAWRMQNCFR